MALAEFILGLEKRHTRIGDNIVVDVTEMIVTDLEAEVTRFPVERSKDISDHIKLGPVRVQITGFVGIAPLETTSSVVQSIAGGVLAGVGSQLARNTRIGGASLIGTGLGAAVGARIGGALASYLRTEDADYNFPMKALKALRGCFEARKPFTIRTYFFPEDDDTNLYTNMVITQLTVPQEAMTGDGLAFTLTAESINLVDLDLVQVSGEFIKGFLPANSAPTKSNLGKQGTTDPTSQTQRRSTALKNTWEALSGSVQSFFGAF